MSALKIITRQPDSRPRYISHSKAIEEPVKVPQEVTLSDSTATNTTFVTTPKTKDPGERALSYTESKIQELINACAEKDIALRLQLQEQEIMRRIQLIHLLKRKILTRKELEALGATFNNFHCTAEVFGIIFRHRFMRPDEFKIDN